LVRVGLSIGGADFVAAAITRAAYAVSADRDVVADCYARTIAISDAIGNADVDANFAGAPADSRVAARVSKLQRDDHIADDGQPDFRHH